MPHSCAKCNQVYPDQSEAILKGCSCGSRIFCFIKSELPNIQVVKTHNIMDMPISQELIQLSSEKTVVIDADGPENIRVIEPGSYELNVGALFKGDPVILRTDADVYYVKLPGPKGKKKS